MRIVYIHQYYCNPQMAGGIRSFEQARRLARNGHDVHVITTDVAPERAIGMKASGWRRTEEDGVHVHWLPVPYSNEMSVARRLRAFLGFMMMASVQAVRLRGDLVFATSTPLTVAVPGVLASKLCRVPFVFEVRDLWPEVPIAMGALRNPVARKLAGALATFAYRNAEEVVALSPGMAAGVTARRSTTPVTIVPNAADLELFAVESAAVQRFRKEHRWLGDRPLIVYTGTLGLVNGVGYLIHVARRMRELDPGVRVLIVGQGREWAETERLATAEGLLGTTVHMWPSVPKSDLPVILGAATFSTSLVRPIPALWENSANKFFDALAAGRPIAINHGGWQADLLTDSGAGLVLDPYQPDAAGDLLARHIRNEDWLTSARTAARRMAVERFSRKLLFAQFEAVLNRAADKRASRQPQLKV